MQEAKVVKVQKDRGYLAKVGCPRCTARALYHPAVSDALIICVGCNFKGSTVKTARKEGH